ncbi:MAG: DUF3800 domain-containing protein [Spirochaetales bacterium]|nr:DUF3800 domain-containing protein [Spirochaetales bacterium]
MKELSIFIDESGDFGDYKLHSSYYIISLVCHDQSIDINPQIRKLEESLSFIGYPKHCTHAGPIIRNEHEYRRDTLKNRQRILKVIASFLRHIDVNVETAFIEKKQTKDVVDATGRLSKEISAFIRAHYVYFQQFDVVKVYYDNGQVEVSKILSSVFNALLDHVEFRRVFPSEYRLFQVADLVCTLQLLKLKDERHELSRAEKQFFSDARTLRKNYLKILDGKRFDRP